MLVFDEGDQLLDMGFQPAILQIMKKLPRKVRGGQAAWPGLTGEGGAANDRQGQQGVPGADSARRHIPAAAPLSTPQEQFQTLVFSATMPEDLRSIIKVALSADHQFVDCVGEEQATHQHVPQQSLVRAPQAAEPWRRCRPVATVVR